MTTANTAGNSDTPQTSAAPSAPVAPSTTPSSSAPSPSGSAPAAPAVAPSTVAPSAPEGGQPVAGAGGPQIDDAYLEALSGIVGDILGGNRGQPPQQPAQPHPHAHPHAHPQAQPQYAQQPQVPPQQQPGVQPVQPPQTPAASQLWADDVLAQLGQEFPGLPDKVLKPIATAIAARDAAYERRFAEFQQRMEPMRQEFERIAAVEHERHVTSVHRAMDGWAGWEAVYGKDGAKLDPESPQAKARESVYALGRAIAARTGKPLVDDNGGGALQDAHLIIHRNTLAAAQKRASQRTPAGAGATQSGSPTPGQFSQDQVRARAQARYEALGLGS